jgi:molybdopterin converting factor small subunit
MAVTILIPTALRAFADGQREIRVDARSASGAITAFADAYPDIRQHLYDAEGALRPFINIYVNGKKLKNAEGLDAPLPDGETIMLVPAIAGGKGDVA